MARPAAAGAYEHPLERVLVVEDHDALARFLARALAAAGFAPTVAADGRAALEHFARGEFELVLLDLNLPGVDGYAVLRDVAAAVPDQPVLVLSGVADARAKVRCLELGACDYVTKPFALPELIARVRVRARERSPARTTRHVRRGRYVLDRRRCTVADGERTVVLTARELALLEYLMSRDGEVCTRAELLAGVWGFPAGVKSNVVSVYVARLRHKLGASVVTEPHLGYRFAG